MTDSSRTAIAIIPARGGSKRLRRKNVIDFAGKPMIAWTIAAAREAGLFDRVVVSTDDPEIAEVSRAHSAEVPFLRETAFDDVAPVSLATCATLEQLRRHGVFDFDTVVQLMPNCPLRTASDIREVMSAFRSRQSPFVLSCFRYGWMNPWWAVKLDEQGFPTPIHQAALTQRSQDLPDVFCPTGAVWIARCDALQAAKTFYGPGHTFFPIPWQSAVDIDDAADLEMAHAVLIARTAIQSRYTFQ